MIFQELPLPGVFHITLEPDKDDRGSFARIYCQELFRKHGLCHEIRQVNLSQNLKKGTLRGMNFQTKPHAEAKMVQCTQGSIFDVVVDLRKDSPSYRQWHSMILKPTDPITLYIPEGVAHGFLTLEDRSTVFYHMFHDYHPECSRGVRWNDPAFGVSWPFEPVVISEKDTSYPSFSGIPICP
jgi:dTDP-4-dehydrorhamnose 3,5-epimerase